MAGKATVTSKSGLYVRKGPGTSYAKLGLLSYKTTVNVAAKQNGWYQISYAGKKGYISSHYTNYSGGSSSSASTSSAGSSASSSSSTTYTVTADALNVRSGAGTNHNVIGTLKKGQSVNSSGESSGWLKISYNNKTGYISKKYTKAGGSSSGGSTGAAAAQNKNSGKTGKVTCATLNVRKGAGTNYGVLGQLKNGNSFTYTAESGGWLKINFGSGSGWISKAYTTVGGGKTTSGNKTNNGGGSSSSGGSVSEKMRKAGEKAASKARSLKSTYVSNKWTYSQKQRTKSGHYDCSSFTHRCWDSAGVNFGWSNTEGQALKINKKGGQVKNTSSIIPGDLLFYHNNWNSGPRWKGINHVAIAIGGGQRIDAGGTPVKTKGLGSPVYIGRPGYLL